MTIRLTSEEAWALVTNAHTGIFVTLRSDGTPIALPMWFVVLDGAIYVHTPRRSKKVARIRRNPRASFLVEEGERWAELRAVHLTGRAEIVEDAAVLERFRAVADAKYTAFRTPRAAMPERTRQRAETIESVLVRIVPDAHVLSWDNRKLWPA